MACKKWQLLSFKMCALCMRFTSFIYSIFSYDIFRIDRKRQQCHAYVVVCLCYLMCRSFCLCVAVCIMYCCSMLRFSVLSSVWLERWMCDKYDTIADMYGSRIRVLCTNVPFLNTEYSVYMHSIASCYFSVFSLGSTIWQLAMGNSSYFIFVWILVVFIHIHSTVCAPLFCSVI